MRIPQGSTAQAFKCPHCQKVFRPARRGVPGDRIQDSPSPAPGWRRPADDDEDYPARRRDELPAVLPGGSLTVAVITLLAVTIGNEVLQVGVGYVRLTQLGEQFDQGRDTIDADSSPTDCLTLLVLIPTATVFAMWMCRSYQNLLDLRVRGLRFSPGWAAGYFFIPILMLYRPVQVAQEMYRASGVPDTADPLAWRNAWGSGVIGLWWTFWIISSILYNVSQLALREQANPQAGLRLKVIAGLLSVVAAAFAIGTVCAIRTRQEAKLAALRDA